MVGLLGETDRDKAVASHLTCICQAFALHILAALILICADNAGAQSQGPPNAPNNSWGDYASGRQPAQSLWNTSRTQPEPAINLDRAPAEDSFLPDYAPHRQQFPPAGPPPDSYVIWPDEHTKRLPAPGPRHEPYEVRSYKEGFFQKLYISGTWIPRDDDFGLSAFESLVTVGVPFPTIKSPMLISAGFNTRLLDGPTALTLPPRLFDGYLEFRWLWLHWEPWKLELAVSPGLYGDWEQMDGETFRVKVRTGARYDWSSSLSVLFGVLYLDRDDIPVLPVGGIIWTPSADWRYELVFPRSKIAWRYHARPWVEDWCFVAAEFTGDQWSIERLPGVQDVVRTRDVWLSAGIERKRDGGGGHKVELGYVLSREIELESGPEISPDGTLMLKASWAY